MIMALQVIVVALFFLPVLPSCQKILEGAGPLYLPLYWVILAALSIILGLILLKQEHGGRA